MLKVDLTIIGSGFGGSLLAMIARRLGLSVALIERGSHPRFAIGESSTPNAAFSLERIADRYDLPGLLPFCNYGTWIEQRPEIRRGLKRGFSYFHHREGEPFRPNARRDNELLVAANPDSQHGDAQWLRSDFDAHLVKCAEQLGAHYRQQTAIKEIRRSETWRLQAAGPEGTTVIETPFLVDATGGAFLASHLQIPDRVEQLKTNTRMVFSHFENIAPWETHYRDLGGTPADHVFPCDAAALHHVFDGGWMWVLRFDHGPVSAGFALDCTIHGESSPGAEREWRALLARYPSIGRQFQRASATRPLTASRRIQRLASGTGGPGWIMLPSAAYFIDPLFSTGIAHTLLCIERLAGLLEAGDLDEAMLQAYDTAMQREVAMIDDLVSTCYRLTGQFDRFVNATMLYFCAATFSEHQQREAAADKPRSFLLSDSRSFAMAREEVTRLLSTPNTTEIDSKVQAMLSHVNVAGLCDPTRRNGYPWIG